MDFHDTITGQHFFNGTMPRIARSLERIADSLEKQEGAQVRVLSANPGHDLAALMLENPDLPVVPMVTSGIVAEDTYARWIASFGSARVDKYIVGSERVFFYSEKNKREVEELVFDLRGGELYDKMTDEEIKSSYECAPWKRAIIVNINEPEN